VNHRRVGAILVALACGISISGRVQSPAGDVVVPRSVYRPPVVLIVSGSDASTSIAGALETNGIASLTCVTTPRDNASLDLERAVRDVVARITALRNDARFPTVSVLGRGAAAGVAAEAARLARADGFIAMAPVDAAADVARLIVPVFEAPDGAAAGKAIGDFLRRVPPLGRRGTREPRPVTPRLSPRGVAMATIGGALVGIEYGSPQTRGREIWGVLVPWNRVWMPGADEATTLSTSAALSIGGVAVPAGDHSFYFWPRAEGSALIISRDVGQFHTVYNPSLEIGRAEMALVRRPERVEGLAFSIEPRDGGGRLTLTWDDREYGVSITAGSGLPSAR